MSASIPVETLPGIGKVAGRALRRRGIETVLDLLFFLPRGYHDERELTPLCEIEPGERVVTAGVVATSKRTGRRRGSRLEVSLTALPGGSSTGRAVLRLVWFNAPPGLDGRMNRGDIVRVAGTVTEYRGVAQMAHPDVMPLRANAEGSIVPRYSEVSGVAPRSLRKAIDAAATRHGATIRSLVPDWLAHELGWLPLGPALVALHRPPRGLSDEALDALKSGQSPEHERLKREELFLFELALAQRRHDAADVHALSLPPTGRVEDATRRLPFALTTAQRRVVAEVSEGLAATRPMTRLLQGDVGSGKTVVAYLAAVQAAAEGAQTALMVPTEILAEQHATTFRKLGEEVGLRVGLFTASVPTAKRRAQRDDLAAGRIDVAIGTHALIGKDVVFHRLALAIVDEQHRFGVGQRLQLVAKGRETVPHLLVTTATPIPRSLAHALYGELGVSLIDELPPGRIPPTTRLYPQSQRPSALRQLERALSARGRAFVVCPRIDEEGESGLRAATATFEELAERFGADAVALLHGRMNAEERSEIMRRFVEGPVRVLVSTTVVEVGVDVPDANVILIEHAERFGLAQLHQLRGRVGRRGQRSACLLVHSSAEGATTEDAAARLSVLCESHDGFRIAEEDLAIRGPGDLLGVRQAGVSALRFGDLRRDLPLLKEARGAVSRLRQADPGLDRPEHAGARAALRALAEREAAVVREEAG